MSSPHPMPPWLFNLDGTFLGFLGSDPSQSPYLALDVEQEQMTIQLPQDLWQSLQMVLRPGDRIRCIGRSQLDWQAKTLQLSAYQVLFPLP